MPLLVLAILLPLIIVVWALRYYLTVAPRQRENAFERTVQEKVRADLDAKMARPLKDYLDQLKTGDRPKIPFRFAMFSKSRPTPANIKRLAALTFKDSAEEFYVKDTEGNVYGPSPTEDMRKWILENRVHAGMPVSSHPHGPWIPAKDVRALKPVFQECTATAHLRGRFDHMKIQ